MDERLMNDMEFCILLDNMKKIKRQTRLIGSEEREDDAQHSYHVAMMAIVLEKYSDEKIDINKVVKMLLIHDLVELYAGDAPAYDKKANEDKEMRELLALEKVFNLLDPELENELKLLWLEFEKGVTPEAKFANSIDRLQPVLNNFKNNGDSWSRYGVKLGDVMKRIAPIEKTSKKLWEYVMNIVNDAVAKGHIIND